MASSEFKKYKWADPSINCDGCKKIIKEGELCNVSLDEIFCEDCFYAMEAAYDEEIY